MTGKNDKSAAVKPKAAVVKAPVPKPNPKSVAVKPAAAKSKSVAVRPAVATPKAFATKPAVAKQKAVATKSAVAKPKSASVKLAVAKSRPGVAKPRLAVAKREAVATKSAVARPKSGVTKPRLAVAKREAVATTSKSKPKLVGAEPTKSGQTEPVRVEPAPTESLQPEPNPTKRWVVLHYLGVGVSAGLLAFVLLIAALAIVVPAISGSTPMTILTGSMTPTYPAGTLIIVKPVNPDTLVIGDPITYQIESGKPAVVTHRIIAITSVSDGTRTFTTQGDANNTADPKPVLGAQVRGKVWYGIPYLGWVNTVVNGQSRAWLIPLIAIALFGYAGYQAASGIAGAIRKRRAAETSPSAEETPGTDVEEMPELVDAEAHSD